jgi:hypothetical protein
MHDGNSQLPPSSLLILGVVSFSAAVVWTGIGKARARFGGWVYRAQEPTVFWMVVATYYLAALLFVGLYLYEGP